MGSRPPLPNQGKTQHTVRSITIYTDINFDCTELSKIAGNPPPYTPLKEDYQSPPQGYPPGYGTPQHQGYPTAPPPQGYPPSQQSAYPPQQVIVVNNQTPLAPAANNTVLVTTTTARP
ncbi:hypothetical protein BSL78_02532 [Apostichopus japonicus]|uniref:Uncharacterized protein n=1 Tax=Stichopus japonicus TaxID=307972 RepID=A0A2G8LJU9_STIJA|nr:hypothetical protein BSL78_02532 [Apostichopus japonicus]